MATPSLVHAAESFFPSRVQPGSGAPKMRAKRAGHSLPACECGALHSKHISSGRMCGYGKCEPRIDGEYGIQTSVQLRALAAYEVERGCLAGAPSVRGATYAGGGVVNCGSAAACVAACIAAS